MSSYSDTQKGGLMDKIIKTFQSIIKGIDEKEQTITALVSTGARDRMDESLDPAGVNLSHFRKNPVVLWAHDYSSPPIAKALWIKKDGDGVLSKMKFANTEFAQEIFQLYKDGFLKAFSVGFMPTKWEDGDGEKKPRRKYTDWELLEYSAVPVPANPEALTLAMQKGILKQESIKVAMEKSINDDGFVLCEDVPENKEALEHEEIKEPEKFGELMAQLSLKDLELKAKEEKIAELEKEIQELRYKVYTLLFKAPEVTDNAEEIKKAIVGVIRKLTGKVD